MMMCGVIGGSNIKSHKENKMDKSIQSTIKLMKSLAEDFGRSQGSAMFDKIREVLPEELNHAIIMHLLQVGEDDTSKTQVITNYNDTNYNKVVSIRALRQVTGMTLKESIELVKDVINGVPTAIEINVDVAYAKKTLQDVGFTFK